MSELLFEIGSEELPASYAMDALAQLPELVARELSARGLPVAAADVKTAGSPRRLAVGVANLADATPRSKKAMTGPPVSAAYKDGKPTGAAIGFAQKCGVPVEKLTTVKTDKGEYIAAEMDEGGQMSAKLLEEALPKILEGISFPKSMRWSDMEVKYARPVQWLVAVFAGKPIGFTWGGLVAGNVTRGHRFLHRDKAIIVAGWQEYLAQLERHDVIADPAKRKVAVREAADAAAAKLGGKIEPDESLLDQVSFLVEKPWAIAGTFEKELLDLPREVIVTPMKHHQRYFPVIDGDGKLMPHFVTIAATPPNDAKVVARGNERVLRSRLSDAQFFFGLDKSTKLEEIGKSLDKYTFQEKLGSYAEKVERMRVLAKEIRRSLEGTSVKATLPAEADLDRAALLSKADLQSKMVFEFPELQGQMGREYARLGGEKVEVANAIAEHYQPKGSGDSIPASDLGAIVSIADRLDTLAGIFGIGAKPTGSTDPYGLRRHALAILSIARSKGYPLNLPALLEKAAAGFPAGKIDAKAGAKDALEYVKGRLENMLRDDGVAPDAVVAALSARFDDPIDAAARARAIADLKKSPDFEPVATAFKRSANLLAQAKPEDLGKTVDPSAFAHDSEKALHAAAGTVAEAAKKHAKAGLWREAIGETVKLKNPLAAFYDGVMVMDKDDTLRRNRLALLSSIVVVFAPIADFTKLDFGKST